MSNYGGSANVEGDRAAQKSSAEEMKIIRGKNIELKLIKSKLRCERRITKSHIFAVIMSTILQTPHVTLVVPFIHFVVNTAR